MGFKVLYRIEREKLVAGGVTELPAKEGLNCGFGVDGGGNKLATIILIPENDEGDAFKDVSFVYLAIVRNMLPFTKEPSRISLDG